MDTAQFDNMSYKQLAKEFRRLQSKIEALEEEAIGYRAQFDTLRKIVVPRKMEEDQMDVVTITGIGRFSVTGDMYCNTPADKRLELQKWLIDRGAGDLIQPTVNGSTLKAFIKERIEKGEDIPSDIVKIEPFLRASLTKVST